MTIKIVDINKENSLLHDSFFRKLSSLYKKGDFTLGFSDGPVEELEKKISKLTSRKYALGVSSGTFALEAASYGLGIKSGDEVIVPANTFISTATAAAKYGAKIVLADVDYETMNISKESVSKVISSKTKYIFGVNLYGNCLDYDELSEFQIPIVEDAAHSFYASFNKVLSGKFGKYSAFSFFPTKVFGSIGDAGMLLFDDDESYETLKAYRNCGQSKSHYGEMVSSVGRMHVIQALFLLEKLKIIKKLIEHRRKIARIYDERFLGSNITTQKIPVGSQSSYFAYVIRHERINKIKTILQKSEIPFTVQYKYTLDQQPFWKDINSRPTDISVSKKCLKEMISIPINFALKTTEAEKISDIILKAS